MPSNYTRKRGARPYRTGYTEEQMQAALDCVRKGTSVGKAAKENGVPKGTLYDKVKGMLLTHYIFEYLLKDHDSDIFFIFLFINFFSIQVNT